MLGWLWVIGCGGGEKAPDTAAGEVVDLDRDGFPAGEDCDDQNPQVRPDALEICNEVDDDCDGRVDLDDDSLDPASLVPAFQDQDGDGAGDPDAPVAACRYEAGLVASGNDCDDADPGRSPAALEVCNGADDNCNDLVDEEDPTLDLTSRSSFYPDEDGDGWGRSTGLVSACLPPAGFVDRSGDCDDTARAVNPDATEVCGDADEDCDGLVDDQDDSLDPGSASAYYPDEDRDGFGQTEAVVFSCEEPRDHVPAPGDCDDEDGRVNPDAVEVCGGGDEDCDGRVDDDDDSVDGSTRVTVYTDGDGDGVGAGAPRRVCAPGPDQALVSGDCDDADPARFPGAAEACGGGDEDCDGLVDDADPSVDPATFLSFFTDGDGDGFGVGAEGRACVAPPGTAEVDGDCNDLRAAANPAAVEVCGFGDDDCDGLVDEDDPSLDLGSRREFFLDEDGDGYGAAPELACDPGPGRVAIGGDCDDDDPLRAPLRDELCNGWDDDCNLLIDDADPGLLMTAAPAWFVDDDGDGWGTPSSEVRACLPPPGTVAEGGDCLPTDPTVHPGAIERCDGGLLDEDCDGLFDGEDPLVDPVGALVVYRDEDGDGFGDPDAPGVACAASPGLVVDASDCDDTDPEVRPTGREVCGGSDEDCDGLLDEADPDVLPTDRLERFVDADGDGFGGDLVRVCTDAPGLVVVGGDCDDARSDVGPGAIERCNGLDDDCDGLFDELDPDLLATALSSFYLDEDGDGFGGPERRGCFLAPGEVEIGGDCDDLDPDRNPEAVEACNGLIDDDCDGLTEAVDPSVDLLTSPAWYPDGDADGAGHGPGVVACLAPPGHAAVSGDCDDADPSISPLLPELCDGRSTRCDPSWTRDDGLASWHPSEGVAEEVSERLAEFRTGFPLATSGELRFCGGDFLGRVQVLGEVEVELRHVAGPRSRLVGDGGGAVLSGQGSRVVVEGLTLGGGCGPLGGVVQADLGSWTLRDVVLEPSSCALDGGALAFGGDELSLIEVVVEGSRSDGRGGAVYASRGSLVVEGGRYQGNSADQGGAFALEAGVVATFSEVDLLDNAATEGGALFLLGEASLVGGAAWRNQATQGGAVYGDFSEGARLDFAGWSLGSGLDRNLPDDVDGPGAGSRDLPALATGRCDEAGCR